MICPYSLTNLSLSLSLFPGIGGIYDLIRKQRMLFFGQYNLQTLLDPYLEKDTILNIN